MHPITTRHPSLEAQFREHEVKAPLWRNAFFLKAGGMAYGALTYQSAKEADNRARLIMSGEFIRENGNKANCIGCLGKSVYIKEILTVIQIPVAR